MLVGWMGKWAWCSCSRLFVKDGLSRPLRSVKARRRTVASSLASRRGRPFSRQRRRAGISSVFLARAGAAGQEKLSTAENY